MDIYILHVEYFSLVRYIGDEYIMYKVHYGYVFHALRYIMVIILDDYTF